MSDPKKSSDLVASKLSDAAYLAEKTAQQNHLAVMQAVNSLRLGGLQTAVLELGTGWRTALENLHRNTETIRAILGPLEELRRAGISDSAIGKAAQLSEAFQALTDYKARFRLPEISEAAQLIGQLDTSGLTTNIRHFQDSGLEFQKAMEAMRTPWLDMQNRLQSLAGFVEMQNIGIALRSLPTFGEKFTDQLRMSLGDWRGTIHWPENIFSDALARSEFYVGKGFDPRLTDFPAEAFREGIGIAGLAGRPVSLLREYEGENGGDDDDVAETRGFKRTNAAHDRLLRFETQLRKFIEQQMRAAFGDDWIKHRVPGEIWQRWLEKQELARQRGETAHPLIAYADFTDYVPIITRKDNWNALFQAVFRRADL